MVVTITRSSKVKYIKKAENHTEEADGIENIFERLDQTDEQVELEERGGPEQAEAEELMAPDEQDLGDVDRSMMDLEALGLGDFQSRGQELQSDLVDDTPRVPQRRLCEICDIILPFRARHCRKCGVCVNKFDHHCFWIGTNIPPLTTSPNPS